MKRKYLFIILILLIYAVSIAAFPSGSSSGALNGIKMCCSVIIPSLFPFAVATLIIFEYISRGIKPKNYSAIIMLFSFIGGYPVGSKLIENAYASGIISKKKAELMLGYCVNSGPSFIIIFVGNGVLKSRTLGFVLLLSNLLSSLIIFLIYRRLEKSEYTYDKGKIEILNFSDSFVKSTYDAAYSMIGICAFVVLFSSIIGTVTEIFCGSNIKQLTMILEVSNGIIQAKGNILIISFLLGFAGISVHFQILSLCNKLKPNYMRFLFSRIFHGLLSAGITFLIIKCFKIRIPTLLPTVYSVTVSEKTLLFSLFLMLTSIIFMVSISKICRNG